MEGDCFLLSLVGGGGGGGEGGGVEVDDDIGVPVGWNTKSGKRVRLANRDGEVEYAGFGGAVADLVDFQPFQFNRDAGAYISAALLSLESSVHKLSAAATRSLGARVFACESADVRLKNFAGCLLMFP